METSHPDRHIKGDILDLETLKMLYANIKNSNSIDSRFDFLISRLKNTALKSYDKDDHLPDVLNRKRYAFELLQIISRDVFTSNDFCLIFYFDIVKILHFINPQSDTAALQKLDEYIIESSIHSKMLILQTLLICLTRNGINLDVFLEYPSSQWRKELLMLTLISGENTYDSNLVEEILDNINTLEEFLKTEDLLLTLEEVLEILVCHQDEFGLDAIFINDVLRVARSDKEIFQELRNFTKIKQLVELFKIRVLISKCVDTESSMLKTKSPQDIIKLKYLTKYPIRIILLLCSKIGHAYYKDLISFIDVLQCWDIAEKSQVSFLFSLEGTDSIHICKYKICFDIIRKIIDCMFPFYAAYTISNEKQLHAIKTKALCEIFTKKTFTIECSCSNINGKCKLHRSVDCCDLLYTLNCSLARAIFNCKDPLKKSLQTIQTLITKMNTGQRIAQLIEAFEIIYEYNLKLTNAELKNLLLNLPAENCDRKTHDYAVQSSFPGTHEKTEEEIIEELEHLNPGITCSVVEQFISIKDAYDNRSVLFSTESSIKSWGKEQTVIWARMIKTLNLQVADEEIVAVLKRAAEVTVKLKLRDIQLLSIIVMLKSNKGKGRLAQINTGEGKTLIIAILAAYYVLKGNQVDVYTSSPLLATPSKQITEFYELVGITVSHNIFKNSEDYKSDVVYGTNNSFQAGVLLDEFRRTGVRKGRKFCIAIIDEVDNMLIDGNNCILKLSCDMPAMDYLEVILATISIQVNAVASSLAEDETGQVYYLEQERRQDDSGQPKKEVQEHPVPIKGTKVEFITKCTENHIRKLIRDPNYKEKIDENYPEIKIPKHLKEVVCKVQLNKWINSAIRAIFYYVQNEDYILRDGKVLIVDARNTGTVKRNSQWCAGLHQFLEIKHGAKIRPESFTTNFVSNVGLFSRYNSIYGLSGTLGSNEAKHFLHTTYDVDSVIIPPFKLRQHKHLMSIILTNESDWYLEVAKNCIRNLQNGRAVLVIMKYIRETEELARVMEEDLKLSSIKDVKIKLYKTDDHSNVVEEPLKQGEVIVTTNIAGRGTDIELTSEVEKNGGLHVCLTFLPINTRVEKQNIGRTSRKGNRGTSQFILHEPNGLSVQHLKAIRSRKENKKMTQASETVKRVKVKDKVFQEFCLLLGEIEGRNPFSKKWELTAVEERFSIWLQMHEDQFHDMGEKEVLNKFNDFRKEIKNDDSVQKLIKNPNFYVKIGNDYLKDQKYQEAVDEYTQAVILDDDFAEHAYYNRAWAYLSKYGEDLKKHEFFIDLAISDLTRARKLINDKEYALHILQNASSSDLFSEQVTHKLNIYTTQKNTIEAAIGPDVAEINEQLKKLYKDKESKDVSFEEIKEITEVIEYLEKRKDNIGVIRKAKESNQSIKIESLKGDDFMVKSDRDSHNDEIEEFKRNGWIGGFTITEVKPIDWTSVACLLIIGLGQLFLGAAICVFSGGFGSLIGIGLIAEGVSDIITAIKDGIISRDFSWATWTLQKVISTVVSVIFAGFSAIRDVAKVAIAGAKNLVTMGTKAFTEVTKEGFKLVAKRMGLELAKGVAKEIITDLAKYGIDQTLMLVIEETIINMIKDDIEKALVNNSTVEKMLKLDEKNQNRFYENQINLLAQGLLNPEQNTILNDAIIQIATHVSNNTKLGTIRMIGTAIYGMCKLIRFKADFIEKITLALDNVKIPKEKTTESNNESSTIDDNKSSGGSSEYDTLHFSDEQEVYESAESTDQHKLNDDDIDLSKLSSEQEQVTSSKSMKHSPYDIANTLTNMTTAAMLNIIRGKLISPLIQVGANYTVAKFCSKVNGSLENKNKVYSSMKRIISDANKKNSYNKPSYQVTLEDFNKATKITENLRQGGPAGLVYLGAVSAAVGKPIEVYNEKNQLMFPIGTHLKGKPIKIEYHAPKGGKVGHFTLKGNREPKIASLDSNMCLFNVVAEEASMNPTELKSKTLNIMNENVVTVVKQVKDIKRLEMHSQSKLVIGGVRYNGKCPDHAKHFLRNSYGTFGHGNPRNPGHPNIHFPYKNETIDFLNAVSKTTAKRIEVYDKKGNLSFVVGYDFEGEPLKYRYNKPKGNTSEEYFSSIDGNEKYIFQNPNDTTFYDIVNKHLKRDPEILKQEIINSVNKIGNKVTSTDYLNSYSKKTGRRIDIYNNNGDLAFTVGDKYEGEPMKMERHEPQHGSTNERFSSIGCDKSYTLKEAGFYHMASAQNLKCTAYDKVYKTPVPDKEQCVENKSKIEAGRTGFRTEDEMAYVLHHVMQTKTAKIAMDKLNQYDKCVNNTERHYLETLSKKSELKVEVYGNDGKLSYTLGENFNCEPIKLRNQDLKNCNVNKAHPANYLNTIANKTGSKIEVYRKDKLAYTIGNHHEGKPLKLHLVNPEDYRKQFIVIPAKELKLERTAYGGFWKDGQLKVIWPVTDVAVMMQHHAKHEGNPSARPHIQTFFPYPPKPAP